MASPYSTGRQNISRQFSAEEDAVNDRVSSHLTTPTPQMHLGNSLGSTYKMLKEDLELRGAMGDQLAKEQGMAYAQSARDQLARDSEKNEQDQVEAIESVRAIDGLIKSGKAKDWKEAASLHLSENPALVSNPQLGGMMKERMGLFESTDDCKSRELARTAQDAQNEMAVLKGASLLKWYQGNPDKVEAMTAASMKNQEMGLENGEKTEELKRIGLQSSILEAQSKADSLALIGNPEDASSRVAAARFLKGTGLKLADPVTAIRHVSATPTGKEMLGNQRWLSNSISQDPEGFTQFQEALDHLSDPAPSDPVEKRAYDVARRKSQSIVDNMVAQYELDTDKERTAASNLKRVMDVGATVGKSYSGITDELQKIRSEAVTKPKEGEGPKQVKELRAKALVDDWMHSIAISDPRAAQAYKEQKASLEGKSGATLLEAAINAADSFADAYAEISRTLPGEKPVVSTKAPGVSKVATPKEAGKFKSLDSVNRAEATKIAASVLSEIGLTASQAKSSEENRAMFRAALEAKGYTD